MKKLSGGDGYILYPDGGDSSWIGLPDLASKNMGLLIKFEFHIRIFFSVSMYHEMFGIYLY